MHMNGKNIGMGVMWNCMHEIDKFSLVYGGLLLPCHGSCLLLCLPRVVLCMAILESVGRLYYYSVHLSIFGNVHGNVLGRLLVFVRRIKKQNLPSQKALRIMLMLLVICTFRFN